MSTLRQKKLAKEIVNNLSAAKPKTKKEMLVSAGYDETTAGATPQRVIEEVGVQEELRALGFDETSAKRVVGEILLNENVQPQTRLKASEQIFKVHGSYAPDKHLIATKEIKAPTAKVLQYINGLTKR